MKSSFFKSEIYNLEQVTHFLSEFKHLYVQNQANKTYSGESVKH